MQNKLNNYLEGLQKTNSASYVDFPNLKNKLAKHRGMLDELRRGENVQNRRLATWLTGVEYKGFESDWESQQQIRGIQCKRKTQHS